MCEGSLEHLIPELTASAPVAAKQRLGGINGSRAKEQRGAKQSSPHMSGACMVHGASFGSGHGFMHGVHPR